MSSVKAFRSHYHRKVAVNTAYLVPHATVRLEVLGFREHAAPRRCASVGPTARAARGSSRGPSGSRRAPATTPVRGQTPRSSISSGRWCTREVASTCVSLARRAWTAPTDGWVLEALEVARQSGVRLHFAHYRTGPATAGRIDRIMEHIDGAKARGADITFDIYPYPVGNWIPLSLPAWIRSGGRARGDPPAPRRCLAACHDRRLTECRAWSGARGDLSSPYLPANRDLEGMSLSDIAAQRKQSMGETLCALLLEEKGLSVGYLAAPPKSTAVWRQLSRNYMELLARPDYMVCSDITPAGSLPHPRCYGAFPRFLGRLRRDFGTLSLEQMVQRMTDAPARRFGLRGGGHIEKGLLCRLGRVRCRANQRQRDVRRPALAPDRHPVRDRQRRRCGRSRALHRTLCGTGRSVATIHFVTSRPRRSSCAAPSVCPSRARPFDNAEAFARALIEAAPDRMPWGPGSAAPQRRDAHAQRRRSDGSLPADGARARIAV